jgi:hypothetical protein
MQLKDFYEQNNWHGDYSTDKGREHDYINAYYTHLFSPLKEEPISILEIGIYRGHSTRLWRKYFTNAEVVTIENNNEKGGQPIVEGTIQHWVDGYIQSTLDLFEDGYFDFIIDDGPHTLESQIYSAKNWIKKIKSGGRLIIEDIQKIEHFEQLNEVAKEVGEYGSIVDMRKNKGRWDDIIFEVIKK